MSACETIEGIGLHGGMPARVRLLREAGPVRVRSGSVEARLSELVAEGRGRSTGMRTRDGRLRIGTVEHLLAALGGCSIRDGVVIEIEGPEIPLADGGAATFMDAVARLDLGPSAPELVVVRAGSVTLGERRYELLPHDGVDVEVEVDFGDARFERQARWTGGPSDFRSRIAPARTFGFAREIGELMARGLASHVAPESVVVVTDDRVLSAGAPFSPDELARHKLLDLVGDLYAHGGPPLGRVRAVRPGHAATHAAVRQALELGLLAPRLCSAEVG